MILYLLKSHICSETKREIATQPKIAKDCLNKKMYSHQFVSRLKMTCVDCPLIVFTSHLLFKINNFYKKIWHIGLALDYDAGDRRFEPAQVFFYFYPPKGNS